MEFGVNTKFVFRASLSQTARFGALQKKPKGLWSPPPTPPPVGYDHDQRFNGYFFDGVPYRACVKQIFSQS